MKHDVPRQAGFLRPDNPRFPALPKGTSESSLNGITVGSHFPRRCKDRHTDTSGRAMPVRWWDSRIRARRESKCEYPRMVVSSGCPERMKVIRF
jgi:hypothetical protein